MAAAGALLLVVLCTCLHGALSQGSWCGKQYPANPQPVIQPNASNPYPLPSAPDRNFSVTPNLQPYTTEVGATLLVALLKPGLTSAIFTAATTTGLQLVAPREIVSGQREAIPFAITALPQTTGTPTTVLCALSVDGVLLEQQMVEIYRLLPNPFNGSVVKIDYTLFRFLAQNVTTGGYNPIFPYGFYYNAPWLVSNVSNIALVKSQGVTVLQPVYPYEDKQIVRHLLELSLQLMSAQEQEMHAAFELGLHFVVDLKNFIGNDSAITQAVTRFRNHPALLSYYLADEPDGWEVSPQLVQVLFSFLRFPLDKDRLIRPSQASHNLVKVLDAYHPTMLVLNCYNLFSQWVYAADILMADRTRSHLALLCACISFVGSVSGWH